MNLRSPRLLAAVALALCLAWVSFPARADEPKDSAAAQTNAASATPVEMLPAPPNVPPPHTSRHHLSKDEDDGDDHSITIVRSHTNDNPFHDLIATLFPIIALTLIFGGPVMIVFLVVYFRFRRRQETLATVREYLAKGLPVPPQLLEGSGQFPVDNGTVSASGANSRGRCDFRRGIKLAFVGVAVILALYIDSPHERDWGWGLIPLVIGLGYMAVGYFEMSLESKDQIPPASPR